MEIKISIPDVEGEKTFGTVPWYAREVAIKRKGRIEISGSRESVEKELHRRGLIPGYLLGTGSPWALLASR